MSKKPASKGVIQVRIATNLRDEVEKIGSETGASCQAIVAIAVEEYIHKYWVHREQTIANQKKVEEIATEITSILAAKAVA